MLENVTMKYELENLIEQETIIIFSRSQRLMGWTLKECEVG